MPRFRPLIAASSLSILCGMSAPALADEFGVALQSQSVSSAAEPGCSTGNAEYTSAGGYVAGQTTTGAPGCSISSSGSSGAHLTTATLTTASSAANGQSPSSTTTADLSNGSLHGTAVATYGGEASLNAQWWDTLTFTVSGSNPVNIPLTFSVDGTMAQGIGQFTPQQTSISVTAQIHAGAADCTSSQQLFAECVGGVGDGAELWQVNTSPTSNVSVNQGNGTQYGNAVYGFGALDWNPTPAVLTATDFTEGGTLQLDPGTWTVNVGENISMVAEVGSLDFGNTASLSFQVPTGVTYTSASGIFGAVPEPASLTLLATALAGFAVAARRRRRCVGPR